MMKAIVDEVGEDARVLIVEGIAGHPIVVHEREGAERALQEFPGVKVVREVNCDWTANVTKNVVLQALDTYLVLLGLSVAIVPAPTGTVPPWLRSLSGAWSILPILAILGLGIWTGVRRLPCFEQLMATGSEQRAAYTAGVDVIAVRWIRYILGGIFTGIAALSLSALIGSADANMVGATLAGGGMPFALVCLIVGVLALLIGAANGALASLLKVHPLIVTLGIGLGLDQALIQAAFGGIIIALVSLYGREPHVRNTI